MAAHLALWLDFCRLPRPPGTGLDAAWGDGFLRITAPAAIGPAMQAHRPPFVCVEFDYPDLPRLRVVTQLRRAFSSLPLLMLTEYHSEALALWAFRSGVWDYRVKPIAAHTLARLIETLNAVARGTATRPVPGALPDDLIAPVGHLRQPLISSLRTAAALAYVGEHYGEAMHVDVLADLCHLSISAFSRAFHRDQGMSFRRFLLHFRIERAREFLCEPHTSVSEIAYSVGFNDLSQFGRMFRRIVGMKASDYPLHPAPAAAGSPPGRSLTPPARI